MDVIFFLHPVGGQGLGPNLSAGVTSAPRQGFNRLTGYAAGSRD